MVIKRICLIAVGSTSWIAGHIYIKNIIHALSEFYPELDVQLVIHPFQDEDYFKKEFGSDLQVYRYSWHSDMTWWKRVSSILYAYSTGRRPRSLRNILDELAPDFVFPGITGNNLKNTAHWIPDFQHRELPQFFPGRHYYKRENWVQNIMLEAKHIVVSSENAASHLEKYYHTIARVSVLSFRAYYTDALFAKKPLEVVKRYELPEKFYIFSSNFWKHKNHINLFKALKIAIHMEEDVFLVLTGFQNDSRNPSFKKELLSFIKENAIGSNIKILGMIKRSDQVQLLRHSVAIIQPFYFEGWSSLVEDARAIGKPIILSSIPIHHEQNPPDGIFFDPDDCEELANKLCTFWRSTKSGIDLEKEKLARQRGQIEMKTFAEDFIRIATLNQNI